jgi:hypothetical protein
MNLKKWIIRVVTGFFSIAAFFGISVPSWRIAGAIYFLSKFIDVGPLMTFAHILVVQGVFFTLLLIILNWIIWRYKS